MLCGSSDSRNIRKQFVVGGSDPPFLGDETIYLGKLRQAEGCLHAGHPEIVGWYFVVKSGFPESEVAQESQPLGKLRIVGDDHPPLAGGDDLVGIEAEAGHVAEASGHLSLPGRSVRFRTIL